MSPHGRPGRPTPDGDRSAHAVIVWARRPPPPIPLSENAVGRFATVGSVLGAHTVDGRRQGRSQIIRKFVAELLGTALLVFFAVGVATLSFGAFANRTIGFAGLSRSAGVVATAFAFGLVLMALAYVLGPISGCHVNPAVTLGPSSPGRIKPLRRWVYWVAQFAGASSGPSCCGPSSSSPRSTRRPSTGLGTDGYGAQSMIHLSAGGAFLAEVVMTAVFIFVILGVTSRLANALTAGLVIGLSLTFIHMVGIPSTAPRSTRPAASAQP